MNRRPTLLITVLLVIFTLMAGTATIDAASSKKKKNKKNASVDPLYSQSLLRQGLVLMQQGLPEEALKRFQKADAATPGNATIYNMMGLCYVSFEQYDVALEHFDRAIVAIPGYTDARNNRGATYLALEQFRLAEVDFIAVLSDSTYPHRWKVFYNLGMTYYRRGQVGAAEEAFNKAVTSQTPVFEAYLRLAEIAQAQGRIDSALGLIEEAMLKFPERLDGVLAYGRLLSQIGREDDARLYLEDVVVSDPDSELAEEARTLLQHR